VSIARARFAGVRLLALAVGCAGLLGMASAISAPSAAAVLGEKLFFDTSLSADGSISCATCHRPDRAFADGLTVAKGIRGVTGTRNTPSLLNVQWHRVLLWDGRRGTLERQVVEPLTNPIEHGFADSDQVIAALRDDGSYMAAFESAFGKPHIEMANVVAALAAYVRSLGAHVARFDRYHSGGEKTALNQLEHEGLELFRGRAQCATCHVIDGVRPAFTDDQFHALGVGQQRLSKDLARWAGRAVALDTTARELAITTETRVAALGRFNVTLKPADIGKYRTPSLRNVAATAPYMHDGSVATLEDAVERELYYRGVQLRRPLVLTAHEKKALVAFLKALTSESLEGRRNLP
jgi:cytochrome c peroxidase